jgi:membrane-associated phospholipid phosphatase
LSHAYS